MAQPARSTTARPARSTSAPAERARGAKGARPAAKAGVARAAAAAAAASPFVLASEAAAVYKVGRLNFAKIFSAGPTERIQLARSGVPALRLSELAERMAVPQDRVFGYLGIPRSTAIRKIREQKVLSTDEGERVLGVSRLVGLVENIVKESGEPKGFDAARWLASWLEQPLPAFGGKKPGELLDTATGQELVAVALARMQSGAYA